MILAVVVYVVVVTGDVALTFLYTKVILYIVELIGSVDALVSIFGINIGNELYEYEFCYQNRCKT